MKAKICCSIDYCSTVNNLSETHNSDLPFSLISFHLSQHNTSTAQFVEIWQGKYNHGEPKTLL